MTVNARDGAARLANPWRIAGWGLAALLLLLPAVAMQFTQEVDWSAFDFVFAAGLLGIIGLGVEFLVRKSTSPAYRLGAVLALLAAFLTVWATGAVGMIGDEGDPYNLLFLGVILLALLGAIVARFQAAGMARAMALAALAQALAAGFGLTIDLRGGIVSMAYAGLWLLAAALFRKAARDAG